MGKGHEETFHEEDMRMANKSMKRCSTSPAIKEMQIKTTTSYDYIIIKTAKIKNGDVEKLHLSFMAGENIGW